ncbi:hypothetical protein HPB50_007719 [Hyalomma asiaticum]|uniref:Uncharacterized protein n=1 Tax=Hyalomma asiaticum TaxID=266040 RepID=A0ACB7S7B5_HYAAI|nr:hypothetical protein HPB50_007719 [Hyalomma asiaticum]
MEPNLGVAMRCTITYPHSSTVPARHKVPFRRFNTVAPFTAPRLSATFSPQLPSPKRCPHVRRLQPCLASSLLDRAPEDSAAGVFRQLPSRPRGHAPSVVVIPGSGAWAADFSDTVEDLASQGAELKKAQAGTKLLLQQTL